MAVTARLYGRLRKLTPRGDGQSGAVGVVEVSSDTLKDVSDLLDDLGIEKSKVSHIFVNGRYSKLSDPIKDGDRVGIFPKSLSLLYSWYF